MVTFGANDSTEKEQVLTHLVCEFQLHFENLAITLATARLLGKV
jgi:hypothetical protein